MKILPYADLHIEFSASLDTATQTALGEQDAMVVASKQTDVVVLAGDTYTKGRSPELPQRCFPASRL